MKRTITTLLSCCALAAGAADFSVTTKPSLVYFFVVVLAKPDPGSLPYLTLYWTEDKAACDAQATEWTKALDPSKAVCLSHKPKVLKNLLSSDE